MSADENEPPGPSKRTPRPPGGNWTGPVVDPAMARPVSAAPSADRPSTTPTEREPLASPTDEKPAPAMAEPGSTEFAPAVPATVSPPPGAPTKRGWGLGRWVIALLVLAGMYGCVSSLSGSPDDDEVSDYEVRMQCERWVKDRLKSPASAEFSGHNVAGANPSWTVTGVVDSQNGFGAMVRSDWTCSIQLDGDTWRGSARVS